METKRDVMRKMVRDYLIAADKKDLTEIDKYMAIYDNAADDEPIANDNTRQQQIEDLARELFVQYGDTKPEKAFRCAKSFYEYADKQNKESDK